MAMESQDAPPIHMIRLTETQEITPYVWVRPEEDR